MKFYLTALLSAFLFGISVPLNKILLTNLSPFVLSGILYLGAALGIAPFFIKDFFSSKKIKLPRKNILLLIGAIFFGGVLGPVLLLFGLIKSTGTSVSMWLNLELVFTALLGHFFFKDYLDKLSWLGVFGTVTASFLLSYETGVIGINALLLVALACLCWGLDNHFTSLIDGITPSQSTFWKGIFAGIINLSIELYNIGQLSFSITYIYGILVGMFAYGFSITLYIISSQNIGATRGQIIFSTSPFWGILLCVFLLGEKISVIQGISIVILIISIAIISYAKHDHIHSHNAVSHKHIHSHDDLHHNHENKDGNKFHTHWHTHEEVNHSHLHLPDLHHRHTH